MLNCEACEGKGGGWVPDKGPLPSDGHAWMDCPECNATGVGDDPVLCHWEQIADELYEMNQKGQQ